MEVLLGLGCAACGWAAGFVLSAGSRRQGAGAALRRNRALERVRLGLGRLASLRLVAALLARPAWAHLAELVCGRVGELGLSPSTGEAGAAMVLAIALATVLAGLASRSPLGGIVVCGLCVIGVHVLEASRQRRRARRLAEEMPGVFRTLSIALGSGQTLSQAIDYVGSHERGLAAEGFARTALRLRCGIAPEDALERMADELDAPGIGLLVTALLISQRTGCPLRDLFQRSAKLVERQGEFERSLSVKTAQVRLSVRIVCVMPVVMIALLSLMSPDFQAGLATPAGAGSVVLALAMDATALLVIRRLMKGVL